MWLKIEIFGGLESGSQIIGSIVLAFCLAWMLTIYVSIILATFLSIVCGCWTAREPLVDQDMYSHHVGLVLLSKVN